MASGAATATPRGPQHLSTSKTPKNPNPSPFSDPPIANPNPNLNPNPDPDLNPPSTAADSDPLAPPLDEEALSRATHLTRPEVLRLRSRRLKQLSRCYRDHYWALMEELKVQYRKYYWEFGQSPFRELPNGAEAEGRDPPDLQHPGDDPENHQHHHNNNNAMAGGKGDLEVKINNPRCTFVGCKTKAMPLTTFCHLHILSDLNQKLYKPCTFVIKSAHTGPITCGKPILRSTIPSLCALHCQRNQKHVSRCLKKAGLSGASSSKLAPRFHVIIAEYIRHIQAKRRAACDASEMKADGKEKTAS